MMDAGRARRAELLAAYQALAARCRAANASSLAETREKKKRRGSEWSRRHSRRARRDDDRNGFSRENENENETAR
jgi:hypothetical protein